jgi:hypothetical protein
MHTKQIKVTHIGHLVLVRVLENVPQDVDLCAWLDSNTSLHALAVDVLDQLFWGCLLI